MGKEAELYSRGSARIRRAEVILRSVMDTIKIKNPKMAYALQIFKLQASKTPLKLATDGIHLFYDPKYVLQADQSEYLKNHLEQQIKHITFHGLLGHFTEIGKYRFKKLIGRVMDNQVERLICRGNDRDDEDDWDEDDWDEDDTYTPSPFASDNFGVFTEKEVEEISSYGYYYQMLRSREARQKYIMTDWSDDHAYWIPSEDRDRKEKDDSFPGQEMPGCKEALEKKSGGKEGKGERPSRKEIQGLWEQAFWEMTGGNRQGDGFLQLQGEIRGQEAGTEAGSESLRKEKAEGEAEDYRDFLRSFMELRETCREDDNIDPILYSYGLQLYGDVPLIEPMEESEKRAFHHIYIVVDTSGSCEDVIPDFMRELEAIFSEIKQTASIEGIHLLQVDVRIQKEDVFTDLDDFQYQDVGGDWYGFGGTSFVEPLEEAQELVEAGEEVDLLLYLSDGEGDFPKEEPDYPVCFIIPGYNESRKEDKGNIFCIEIPEWVQVLNMERSRR